MENAAFSVPIITTQEAAMQGKVEICGVNTSRLHVLSQVEMDALLRRAQAGDEDAREKLIEGNLRLVLSVIQRFDKRGENPDDLFQVGCIGLIKAISNFDPDKQVRFSTYGVPMIAGEVRRYLRDNNSIRVSRSLRDTAYKALSARELLTKKNLREPTIMEIADVHDLFYDPWHPYTIGLLNSMPRMDSTSERLECIDGTVPHFSDMPAGCPFAPRCQYATEQCRTGGLPPMTVHGTHSVRCWNHMNRKEGAANG